MGSAALFDAANQVRVGFFKEAGISERVDRQRTIQALEEDQSRVRRKLEQEDYIRPRRERSTVNDLRGVPMASTAGDMWDHGALFGGGGGGRHAAVRCLEFRVPPRTEQHAKRN